MGRVTGSRVWAGFVAFPPRGTMTSCLSASRTFVYASRNRRPPCPAGWRAEEIARWRILRKALAARDKDALQFVSTAEVVVPADEDRVAARANRTAHPAARVERYHEEPFVLPPPGPTPLETRPVVVG